MFCKIVSRLFIVKQWTIPALLTLKFCPKHPSRCPTCPTLAHFECRPFHSADQLAHHHALLHVRGSRSRHETWETAGRLVHPLRSRPSSIFRSNLRESVFMTARRVCCLGSHSLRQYGVFAVQPTEIWLSQPKDGSANRKMEPVMALWQHGVFADQTTERLNQCPLYDSRACLLLNQHKDGASGRLAFYLYTVGCVVTHYRSFRQLSSTRKKKRFRYF